MLLERTLSAVRTKLGRCGGRGGGCKIWPKIGDIEVTFRLFSLSEFRLSH